MLDVGLGSRPTRTRKFGPYPSFGLGFIGADPQVKFLGDKLWPNQSFRVFEGLKSKNGRVHVILQPDGNCVLYGDGKPLWWTGVHPDVTQASMQSDGNFVIYAGSQPVWASDTSGHPGGYLFAQDDGNLVLYWRVGGSMLWESKTSAFQYYGGPGKPIGKEILEAAGDVLTVAQVIVSFVPGIGAGINAAIAAGAALAKGENISDAVIDAAENALPGGPVAAQAFKAAIAAGKALANGASIGEASLAATRAALPSPEAQAAFDTGLALIHGQNVQQALTNGGAALAANALSSVALPPELTNVAKSLDPETLRVATAVFNNPQLRGLAASEIAKTLHSDPATVAAATSAIAAASASPPPAPLNPKDASQAMLGALMVWGRSPNDKAAQQNLVGVSWKWAQSLGGNMSPADSALANAINAWVKAPNDSKSRQTLVSAAQSWGAKRGVPAPIKPSPLHAVVVASASKPVPSAPAPVIVASKGSKPMAGQVTYGPYPKAGTLSAPPHGGGHGGGGHHGGGGGRRGGVVFRGGRALPGWGWDRPWATETIVTMTDGCRTWSDPVSMPFSMQQSAKIAIGASQGRPTTLRSDDGTLYQISLERGVIIARTCVALA